MGDLINTVTDFIGGVWDSPAVQFGLRAIAIYIVILWLASAYWAFRDMQLRTANPILPYFAASLIIIFTPVFFIFAVVAYRIVRPHEKIGEVYERTLAEEALLAEVEVGQELSHLRPPRQRRVDHLSDLSHAVEPRLPELQPPRRARLVAVRLVRPRLRARGPGLRGDPGPAAGFRAAPRLPADARAIARTLHATCT